MPQKQNYKIYSSYFGIFESLSTKLFDEFEAIATIQQNNAAEQSAHAEFKNIKLV